MCGQVGNPPRAGPLPQPQGPDLGLLPLVPREGGPEACCPSSAGQVTGRSREPRASPCPSAGPCFYVARLGPHLSSSRGLPAAQPWRLASKERSHPRPRWQRQLGDHRSWAEKAWKQARARPWACRPGRYGAGHALPAGLLPPGPGGHRLWQRQDETRPCPVRPRPDDALPGRWVSPLPCTHSRGRGEKAIHLGPLATVAATPPRLGSARLPSDLEQSEEPAPSKSVTAASGPCGRGRVAKGRGTEGRGKWLPCVLTENEIAEIPAHAFLGAPNLEWLDLNKNKLDALGLHPDAFKVCGSPSSCCPGGWRGKRPWASSARPPALPGVGAVQKPSAAGFDDLG